MPSSATVSPAVSNANQAIEKSIDGDISTIYQSTNGSAFPVIMSYQFAGANRINGINYIPRQTGGNGKLGQVEVWYRQVQGGNELKLLDYNFGFTSKPILVAFPQTLTNIYEITFKVSSGQFGYASCAEMEFYDLGKQSLNTYPNIFNELHSALKSGVTQTDIDGINSPFFKGLAQCLYSNTYNQKFRVQNMQPYPVLQTTADALKIGTANTVENPTGIVFRANTKAVIFVSAQNASSIQLHTADFGAEDVLKQTYYSLNAGVNIIDITNDGLGYIDYYRARYYSRR